MCETDGEYDILAEEEEQDVVFESGQKYTSEQLIEFADKLLREDSNRELCRKCKSVDIKGDLLPYGTETGTIESVPQFTAEEEPLLDDEGNQLYLDFPELKCEKGHRWFKGEGQRRDIRGPNPILFESHLYNRKRREIYVECVDNKTECLTREKGWTQYDQLCPGMEILAFSLDTEQTLWEPVKDVFVKTNYRGPMIRFKSPKQSFEAVVTPDHRWPILYNTFDGGKTTREYQTNELPKTDAAFILGASFSHPQSSSYSDAFVRLQAWNLTEGCVEGKDTGPRIVITQSPTANPDSCQEIEEDIHMLGAKFEKFSPGSNLVSGTHGYVRREGLFCRINHLKDNSWGAGATQWILSGTGIDEFMQISGRNRCPSTEFLSSLTDYQIQEFIRVLMAGDGCKGTSAFKQHNRERMNAATIAFVLGGYALSLESSRKMCNVKGWRQVSTPNRWIHRTPFEKFDYSGTIWCPQVPSGFWLARRDKCSFITGNSGIPDPAYTMDRHGRPTQGMYNRTRPDGRKVNTKAQRARNGASFYR